MVPHSLPLETIEFTLDFLRDDFKALAKCSLVCRALLPTCRTHLYGHVSLSHEINNNKTVETSQTKRFFQLVDVNPAILVYIRDLTLDYGQSIFQNPPIDARDAGIAWDYVLRGRFSSLRALTLCSVTMSGLRDLTMVVTEALPELESLSFSAVQVLDGPTTYGVPLSVLSPWRPEDWVSRGRAARSKLRAFGVVDVYIDIAELSSLVSLLEEYPQLDSLDIRPQLPHANEFPGDPRLIISAFAPRLRHFGVLVYDITDDGVVLEENRERLEGVLSNLPHCGSLRSLCVHYSCFGFCLSTMMSGQQVLTGSTPQLDPFFLDKLCDALSSHPQPFPHFEELTIALHNPLNWIRDWNDAFDRLAGVLVGGRSTGNAPVAEGATLYPKFRRLEICASVSGLVRLMYGNKSVEDALAAGIQMAPHMIPLETIEHTLHFLRDDLRTLAKCSLVCRALLPTCRTHLYRDISLTHQVVNYKTVETSRTELFFQIVDADPSILLYARTLTLDYGQDLFQSPAEGAREAGRAWKYVLRRCFPSLRSLTICYLTTSGLSDLTAAITHFLPELESLSFRDLQVLEGPTDFGAPLFVNAPWSTGEWVARGGPARSNLRAFSLVDLYNEVAGSELSELVSLLGHYPQLDSIDIRPQMPRPDDLTSDPRHLIAEFAPRLRHFGFLVGDITGDGAVSAEDRERMESILAALPRCRSLRSLCVHYSCLGYYLCTMMAITPTLMPGERSRPALPPQLSPFFLDAFCEVLSSTPAPFPLLEELVIVLHNPLTWLRNWADALDRLAGLLIGDWAPGDGMVAERATRFPRFRRLEICASTISAMVRLMYDDNGLEDARMQIREVKEGFLRPILERFKEAGIEVDVKVT
ncbi:hypothetical protein PYCCODRAFT_1479388 [Trametes coccinea BRFM310]|uniref:F-box domain-containing protein n=1 Tax=Trametes coccinea (strain BRFM310) TaxID=1353009 RepID=A0A1Y2IHV9_TRAC3|nr:hypothetical protein PYCCODRAFT_1479388 [Trametes coccinea BRFM310]